MITMDCESEEMINMDGMTSQDKEETNDCNEILPPGFRFHPTDEELVTHYLTNKILDNNFTGRAIAEVDLNKCEPWDLPGKAKMGEKEWYFFSQRDRKYPTGLRTNRATEAGYWKTTGKDREVLNSQASTLVGMKKTLVFYKGRAPKGEKTNWVMHEYRLEGKFSYHRLPKNCKDEWVVCRIFQKNGGSKKISTTSTTGGLMRSSFMELSGSPSLPSLLESPYNNNNNNGPLLNDHEPTVSIECESSSSRPNTIQQSISRTNNIAQYLQSSTTTTNNAFHAESSTNQFSEVDRLFKSATPFLMDHTINFNNTHPTNLSSFFPLTNLGFHKVPPISSSHLMYNPHIHHSLLSNFPNMNFSHDSSTTMNNNSSFSNVMDAQNQTGNNEEARNEGDAPPPSMDLESIWNFREGSF